METWEYGIQHGDRVVVGPGWRSIADVMKAQHGMGSGEKPHGTLVRHSGDGQWQPVGLG